MKARKAYSISNAPLGEQILRLPNILSMTRVALLPFIWYVVSLKTTTSFVLSTIIIGVILLTDAFDGYIAKRLNERTELGLILDPVCDKITTLALLLILVKYYDFPLWMLLIIISKDLAILIFSWIFARRVKAIFRSDLFGRLGFVILSVLILIYSLTWLPVNLEYVKKSLLGLALLFIVLSSVQYLRNFASEWKSQIKKIEPQIHKDDQQ